jgi:hypothetical protein
MHGDALALSLAYGPRSQYSLWKDLGARVVRGARGMMRLFGRLSNRMFYLNQFNDVRLYANGRSASHAQISDFTLVKWKRTTKHDLRRWRCWRAG